MTTSEPAIDQQKLAIHNEKERYLLLDEAVSNSGVGGMFVIGLKSFAELFAGTEEEVAEKIRGWIEWAQMELGSDPGRPGPLMIPVIAIVPDAMTAAGSGVLADGDAEEPDEEVLDAEPAPE